MLLFGIRRLKMKSKIISSKVSIDFLITTVSKTKKEILELVNKMNLIGSVIVGNQKASRNYVEHIAFELLDITIVNMTSIGTSLNRNTIFNYAKSDFVTFWDDDSVLYPNSLSLIENYLFKYNYFDSIRFNTISDNKKRPIKIVKKDKKVGFKDIRSFGVCGVFFKRESLLRNSLLFRVNVGPGTNIIHGEDTLFLYDFFKAGLSMFQSKSIPIHIYQEYSCWYNNVTLEDYYFTQGFIYRIIYPNTSFIHGLYHIFKTIKRFGTKNICYACESVKKGIISSKKEQL